VVSLSNVGTDPTRFEPVQFLIGPGLAFAYQYAQSGVGAD
jgi:hypothetical protein